jgi:hypothetical protein
MKKVVVIALAVAVLVGIAVPIVQAEKSPAAAALLSAIMPGTGEWYNSDWSGGYPWGECIVGHICCLVQLSSVFDAVNGSTDSQLRVDFWSAPGK